MPWVSFGMLGYALYDQWFNATNWDLSAAGFQKCCDTGFSGEINKYKLLGTGNKGDKPTCALVTLCGTPLQVPSGDWPHSIPALVSGTGTLTYYSYQTIYLGNGNTRMTHQQGWMRYVGNPNKGLGPASLPAYPGIVPWISDPIPYPYPYAQEPLPGPHVLERPTPQPQPRPVPVRPPAVRPGVPAIEASPGMPSVPAWHEKRPPARNEKEKKKRLDAVSSMAWLRVLEGTLGSYMELDDTVAALYKGLPYYVRRWKGRDGVWRDRDITTLDRTARLYQYLGKLDVQKAITEVIKDQLTDQAFGRVGKALKRRARELGDAGLYSGSGFQTGGSRVGDYWDELYQQLKQEAVKNGHTHRTFKYREYDEESGTWLWKEAVRPITQIPWYRQESHYPGLARPGMAEYWDLTNQEREDNVRTVRRYYYAPRRTYSLKGFQPNGE